MQRDLISIIVPVYNVLECLKYCVDSLLKQTYKNIEVLLVDDGSVDGSGQLCDELAQSDNRVRVVHQSNQGVSVARNEGLRLAKGAWIMFVDSDDWIDLEMCSLLMNEAQRTNSDICGCDLMKELAGALPQVHSVYKKDVVVHGAEIEDLVLSLLHRNVDKSFYNHHVMNGLSGIFALVGPVCKIYRKDVVAGIEFPRNIHYGEDSFFVLQVLSRVTTVAWLKRPLYHYRYTPSSLVNKYDKRRAEDCICLDNATLEYINKVYNGNDKIVDAFAYGCFWRASRLFHHYVRKTKKRDFFKVCRLLRETLRSPVYYEALRNPRLKFSSVKRKLQLFLLRGGHAGIMYFFVRFFR